MHLNVWNVASGEPPWEIRGGEAPTAYAFSPDSQMLAIGFRDGSAQLWNRNAKELVFQWNEHTSPIVHMAFSADGAEIATAEAVLGNSFGQVPLLNVAAIRPATGQGGVGLVK